MWRYLLAGVVLIAAVLAMFFISFGDPVSIPHSTLPMVRPAPVDNSPSSMAQQRQSIEHDLHAELQTLQTQMAETDKQIERLHTRILQITRDADIAREALGALRHAEEANTATSQPSDNAGH